MALHKLIAGMLMCILVPILAQAALPPHSLSGRILDGNGDPVTGAAISIPELRIGTVSDSDGSYQIQNIPKGRYLVEVHLISYTTATQYVSIENSTEQDFRLRSGIIERNGVIVTGTSLATEERKSVIPIQSIKLKELQESASTNIIDAVSRMPGVSQVTTGPGISKPVIRGLGYNRIITINDGIRQEGQQWGDEHGIEIDDYNVSKIEVLKGPASLAYGSDALAGVINIISDEPIQEGHIHGNIAANYQTNNGLGALNANIAGNIKGFTWNAYGTGKASHDYQNRYDGYVHNSRFSNTDYGAMIGLNKNWGYSHLSFTSFNQDLGIVEGERDSTGQFLKLVDDNGVPGEVAATDEDGRSYSMQLPKQRISHNKLAWNNNIYLNNGGRVGLVLGYQQNIRKEYEEVTAPDEAGLFFQLQTFNYDLKYFFPVRNGWHVTTGLNGMQQYNKNKGIEFLVPDYKLSDAGLYAIAKKDWQAWSVTGGLRYNYRTITGDALYLDSTDARIDASQEGGSTRFNGFDVSFGNIVGSIGASYTVNSRTTIKLNVASGFRAPNIAELAADGVHEGTLRYEYGNTGLKAEQSLQADLGVSWSSEHVLVNASVFYNYIDNYIFIRKLLNAEGTDSIPAINNDEGYAAFMYDQTSAGLYGGELYLDFHPHPLDWLHFEHTFSYVRGKAFNATDSTGNLPAIPPARWLMTLKAQKKSLGRWLRNAYASAGLDWNFAQDNIFSAYSTETSTSAYALLNAGVGVEVVNSAQRTVCSIVLSAQNLGDVAYQSHLSRLKYAPVNEATGRSGVYNAGRNFSLLVNVPLHFK